MKKAALAAGLAVVLATTGVVAVQSTHPAPSVSRSVGGGTTDALPPLPTPNAKLTPGVVDRSVSLHTLCTTSTSARRNTTEATKRAVYAEYGAVHKVAGDYEVDHLIPLELGGADVQKNLWPEPAPSFHQKDQLENRLHALVCSGKVPLAKAQHAIAVDWVSAYLTYMPGTT